jgi:ribosomal protein S18 acetylase RimI-like enzyme
VSVRVRRAAAGDAERMAEVVVRAWQDAYAHLFARERLAGLDATRERRAAFFRRVAEGPPPPHLLVGELGGAVAGMALCGVAEEDETLGELFMIYVAPEASGKGVGRALVAEVLRLLAEDAFDEAVLWVFEDNPRTRCFYEQAGWRADGAAKDMQWLGATVRAVRYRIELRATPR